jgi:hypothetical protein
LFLVVIALGSRTAFSRATAYRGLDIAALFIDKPKAPD